jgi:hypothetical protein
MKSVNRWHPADTALLAVSGTGLLYKPVGERDIRWSDEEPSFMGTHITLWFYGKL